jgi:hypothetical protein
LERQTVGTLRDFDQDRVVGAFVRVILCQLHSETPSLNANGGIALRIESGWAAQYLGCDLILLKRYARMIEGMLCQISQELAQRFRRMKAMAFGKSLYLLEALLPPDRETVCDSHITGR